MRFFAACREKIVHHKAHVSFIIFIIYYHYVFMMSAVQTITKQLESGDMYGNIIEFGVAEGSPEPAE